MWHRALKKKGKSKPDVRRNQQRVLCFLGGRTGQPRPHHLTLFHSEPIGLSKYLIRLLAEHPQGLAMHEACNLRFSVVTKINLWINVCFWLRKDSWEKRKRQAWRENFWPPCILMGSVTTPPFTCHRKTNMKLFLCSRKALSTPPRLGSLDHFWDTGSWTCKTCQPRNNKWLDTIRPPRRKRELNKEPIFLSGHICLFACISNTWMIRLNHNSFCSGLRLSRLSIHKFYDGYFVVRLQAVTWIVHT